MSPGEMAYLALVLTAVIGFAASVGFVTWWSRRSH